MRFETDVRESTLVTFAAGEVKGSGTVLFAGAGEDGNTLVVCDSTPVHPVSFRWPDQPADRGTMTGADGVGHPVVDALTGMANSETGELVLGEDARALGRTGDEWKSVVVHVVSGAKPSIGATVSIEVDADYRRKLSVAHTAAHLSAFALNRASKAYWTKDGAAVDSLGSPDLDKEAIVSASLSENASVDTYRVGKTLRKKGFELDRFIADLPDVIAAANETLKGWLSAPGAISLTPVPSTLDARRLWQCSLDGQDAQMYCAGTHVADLSDLAEVTVLIEAAESGFVMHTRAAGR